VDEAIRLLLTNAVLSGLLALAAWAVSRLAKRQAVVHGLYLLALVKLVTPPLVELPLLPARVGSAPRGVAIAPERRLDLPVAGFVASAHAAVPPAASPRRPEPREAPGFAGGPARETAAPSSRVPPFLRAALPALLALGAFSVAVLAALRFVRFRRLARSAEPAPAELAARAETIGASLGVRRTPELLLLPARVPPLLWPASPRPKLLLPRDLLPDLDDDERDALLAHELAHVRRRDHWVRFLEVGATALFWWYPVAWWSRSALRRAEERCCDEWVVRALPGSARAYASGILKSLTFLSDAPVPMPETASGAGPIRDLESRLKEILMTSPRPRLSRPTRIALGTLAVAALAIFPTVAPPRAAEAAAAVLLSDADATPTAAPAPGAPVASSARHSTVAPVAPAPAASPVLAPAPLAAPAPAHFPALAPRAPLPDSPSPLPDEEDAPDPALEKARRALDGERQRLHLSQLELERRALDLELQAARQEAARAATRRRAEGDAAGAARAEKAGALRARHAELDQRRLELQEKQVRLEIESERAAEAAISEKDAEARARAAERAEAELQKQQEALEAEAGTLERELHALEAEERVHELRGATDDLARSLADQVAGLRGAIAEAGPEKGALEREVARLEAALVALRGPGAGKETPKPAGR
jgi:beta-lactamase regulating signal transducer with metallopeptidase domain